MFRPRVRLLIVCELMLGSWTAAAEPGMLGAEPGTIVSGQDNKPLAPSSGKKVDLWGEPLPAGALARMHATSLRDVRQIVGAALSADGTVVALATNQNQLVLFDARTAKLLKRINVESLGTFFLSFTPGGAKLGWINQEGVLILRDISQDKEVCRFAVAKRRITQFSFSANGKLVAGVAEAIGEEPRVHVWDCKTGKEKERVSVLQNWQVHVALSADGNTLVTWGQQVRPGERARNRQLSQTIQVHNLTTRQEVGRFVVDAGPVAAAVLSPDMQMLAAVAADSTIYLWQISGRQELRRVTGFADLGAWLSFSPDGKSILAATARGAILAFATDTGKNLYRCEGPGCPISSVSSTGPTILAFGIFTKQISGLLEQQTPYLWKVPSGETTVFAGGHFDSIQSLAFSPNGKTLASAGADGKVLVWETISGSNLRRIELQDDMHLMGRGLAFTADGRYLVAAGNRGSCVVDVTTGKKFRDLVGAYGGMQTTLISPDGNRMASCAWRQGTTVWDVKTGRKIGEIPEAQGGRPDDPAAAFSPNGKILAVTMGEMNRRNLGAPTSEIRLWDLDTWKEIRAIQNPDGFFGGRFVSFSPNETVLAWTGHHQTSLLDVATGKELRRLDAAAVCLPCFSPDGRVLAIASSLRHAEPVKVQVWEVASGLVRQEWTVFSPNNAKGGDGLNRAIPPIAGRDFPLVTALAFSANDGLLATGASDGTILIWNLNTFDSAEKGADRLTPSEAKELWSDLGVRDARRGYQAIRRLRAIPAEAVALFQRNLGETAKKGGNGKGVNELISDLDSDSFRVREQASSELRRRGATVRPALEQTLMNKPSAEVRRRVEQLLDKLGEPEPPYDMLRALRILEVLEHIRTPPARQLVEVMAEGAAEAQLTLEAKATLRRWHK